METIRRVVAGIDAQGKSIFVSDEEIEPKVPSALGGNRIYNLWGSNESPRVPGNGIMEEGLRFFPPNDKGHRFVVFTLPPAAEITVPDDLETALAELEELTPGMNDAVSETSGLTGAVNDATGASRLHYTATVDLEYVLEGEASLEVDDGVEKAFPQGTSIVLCGARHAWFNRSDTMAKVLLVVLGASIDESQYAKRGYETRSEDAR